MKKDSLQGVLQNVNLEEIKETMKSFGIENELLNSLSSETINELLSGNFKVILPLIPTLLSTFNKGSFNNVKSTENYDVGEELSPIKDIAPETITSTLGNYFK